MLIYIERLAAQLEPAYEETRQTLMRADTVNFDESGLRVAGRTQGLHVALQHRSMVFL